MSKQPPVPADNQSPFPTQEPPHDHSHDLPPQAEKTGQDDTPEEEGVVGEAIAAAKRISEAKARWKPDASQIGLGAAIGVGSAAIVAGLLYWRGGKK
jgi:hypothetical protein